MTASDFERERSERAKLRNAVDVQCTRCRLGRAKTLSEVARCIANCDDPDCALYDVRPYQGGGR